MKLKRIFQYEASRPAEARVNKHERGQRKRKRKRDELREELGLDNTYDRRRRKPIFTLGVSRPTNFSHHHSRLRAHQQCFNLNNEQIKRAKRAVIYN